MHKLTTPAEELTADTRKAEAADQYSPERRLMGELRSISIRIAQNMRECPNKGFVITHLEGAINALRSELDTYIPEPTVAAD